MYGVGSDAEVWGCQNEMAGIIVNDFDLGIFHHVVVLLAEIFGDDLRNQRLEFANDDVLDARMHQK